MRKRLFFCCLILFIISASGFAPAADKPEIFAQLGHSSDVESLAFSPDGRYAASGSRDNTVKLWEVSTGREVRTVKAGAPIVSLVFSSDGKILVSVSKSEINGTISRWEVPTGRELTRRSFAFVQRYGGAFRITYSPDRSYVVIIERKVTEGYPEKIIHPNRIRIIDVETGREQSSITRFQIQDKNGNKDISDNAILIDSATISVSPDNSYLLISEDHYKNMNLFDIKTGNKIKSFYPEDRYDPYMGAVISPDGRFIIADGLYKTRVVLDFETGKLINSIKRNEGDQKGRKVISFSKDGKYAAEDFDRSISIWEISTGKTISAFKLKESLANVFAFSPDLRRLLSATYSSRTIKLLNTISGEQIGELGGGINIQGRPVFLPDGQTVLSTSGNVLTFWDMSSGGKNKELKFNVKRINDIAITQDGKYALTGSGEFGGISDNTTRLWDISSGAEIRKFTGHTNGVISVNMSQDGKRVISGSWDGTLRVWDLASGREIRRFSSKSIDNFSSVSFSADNNYAIAAATDTKDIYNVKCFQKVFDITSGRETASILTGCNSPGYSPDNMFVFTNEAEGYGLYELPSLKKRKTLRIPSSAYLNVSPNTEMIANASSTKGVIELYDISSERLIRSFKGHSGALGSAAFSKNGKYLVSTSGDGTVKIWDVATGKEMASMMSFTDGEWIVMTPEGYYNSSVNGDKHLNVRIGNNVYGIDQYRSSFYKPQIVEAALRSGNIQHAVEESQGVMKGRPDIMAMQNIEPPFIVVKSPEDGKKVDSGNTDVSLYVEDRNQSIKKVTVFVNGRTMASGESRGVTIASKAGGLNIPEGKKTLDLKIPVALEKGENIIEVVAFNGFSEGSRSIRIYLEESAAGKTGETLLPNLWILSIGVNAYQDKKLPSLAYAAADAEAVANVFKGQKRKLFREVNSLVISDTSLIKPTYDNIVDNLTYLSKAGHRDVVLLFIAGHGINDDRGDFYFLPNDAQIAEDGTIKRSKAISWRELKAVLDLPAKKIILADTCHSEGVSGKKTRGVDNDRFVKELQEANAVIFTSSRGKELSQESAAWKHGAFTHALIEGLQGKADLLKRKRVSMKELDTYVSEIVPQITNGAQHPITNTPDGYVNFPVALVE